MKAVPILLLSVYPPGVVVYASWRCWEKSDDLKVLEFSALSSHSNLLINAVTETCFLGWLEAGDGTGWLDL